MTEPVSLTEAKLFLRVAHGAEDELILTLLEAAKGRVEAETGLILDGDAPAGLRLAILQLTHAAYERGGEPPPDDVRGWLAGRRTVRL